MGNIEKAVLEQLTLLGQKVGITVVVLLIFWILANVSKRAIIKISKKFELNAHLTSLFARTAKITVLIFGVITVLGTLGVDVSALVAGLGLTGFALGFALKDIISNAVAGVLVIIYKPIKYNDRVSVSSFQGKVMEINLRYTVLQGENATIFVPNSTLFTNGITVQDAETGAASGGSG